jgi:hypothetical protein
MKFSKKESVAGTFVKKGQDIKDGDIITINNSGKIVDGQFGSQNVFSIKTKAGEFLMSFNQTSINSLVDEWGEESENWIGKNVKVHSIKQNVAGKFINVYYVAPDGYEMGEDGFEKEGNQKSQSEEVPTINLDDDEPNLNVPF